MATFFLRKKLGHALVCGISIVFVVLSFGYSVFLSQIKVVPIYTSFYFLTTEELHVEAGAELIKLEGGAGYVLCLDGKEYAVSAVYLKESEGESVRAAMLQCGKSVRLLPIQIDNLYLRGSDKKKEKVYTSALNLLNGCISLLQECVEYLDNGATQESIKRILLILRRQMVYISVQYNKEYATFSRLCTQSARELQNIENEIIYASDLRYLTCQMVDDYITLCRQFAL